MLYVDLLRPPASPSPEWLSAFVLAFRSLAPQFSLEEAGSQARHAYIHTWLLAAEEAAQLWQQAVQDRCHPPQRHD